MKLDNFTAPIATCLGDLFTLFILALVGSGLVGTMDTPIPLMAVIFMGLMAVWFSRVVMRDQWVRSVAQGSWTPLVREIGSLDSCLPQRVIIGVIGVMNGSDVQIAGMVISSGTGMVLEAGIDRYRGFALIAIAMTGEIDDLFLPCRV